MKKLLNQEQVSQAIDALLKAVLKQLPDQGPVAVVGIRTRGQTIAQRLFEGLSKARPDIRLGVLDITFYRDDLARRRGVPIVRATDIDFDLEDVWVLLVDDVLQTGRSIRAAMDALHDFGRAKAIRLGVLIDRGGRELPIAADFVGKKLRAQPKQRVQVKLKENDGEEGVYLVE